MIVEWNAHLFSSDVDRYQKLLAALADVPRSERSARFRCVVALALPTGIIDSVDGTCEGEIGYTPRGEHGFGYDPIFVVEGYGGQTLAELHPAEKNRISHRARAVTAARPMLARLLEESQETQA